MPARPFRPCTHPGCGALLNGKASKCPAHMAQARAAVDAMRGNSNERGYGAAWRAARAAFLRAHPLCMCDECERLGRLLPSSIVDHVRPHKGDRALFWDRSNWQALSKPCHDRKTATHDGGFGRTVRAVEPMDDDSLDDWP
jgi:5-methylcytosine-specific restriction enzyme A